MTLFHLTDGARLLGVHPKTLRQWIKQEALDMRTHPKDARTKCLTLAQLSHLAEAHDRQIPQDVSSDFGVPSPRVERGHASNEAHALLENEDPSSPSSSRDEAWWLAHLTSLETKVTTLTEQVAQLALALLETRDQTTDHRLATLESALEEIGGKPLIRSSQPMEETIRGKGRRRINPAEARLRSRLPALIEYSAQGTYVIVSAQEGEIDVKIDEEEWFDWLATISSFRFIGQCGRFSACRTSEDGQQTRMWVARRFFHGHDLRHYLGVTNYLTLAHLEQVAATLQSRVDAL